MKKEEIIQALYDANTLEAVEKAGDDWSDFYQNATPEDREYLAAAMRKFASDVIEKSRQSSIDVQQILAEFEAMKLAESQH
ncbi:MAG: hypothetical protein ACO1N1_04615 [Dyadobacter fermentans]